MAFRNLCLQPAWNTFRDLCIQPQLNMLCFSRLGTVISAIGFIMKGIEGSSSWA